MFFEFQVSFLNVQNSLSNVKPIDGRNQAFEPLSRCNVELFEMDSLIEERRLNQVPMEIGYIYYEVTISQGAGTWNDDSKYQIDVGFSHQEEQNCGKYQCKSIKFIYW